MVIGRIKDAISNIGIRGRYTYWNSLLNDKDNTLHMDHARSQILDAEEDLQIRRFWLRVALTWAIFVNVGLVALAISVNATHPVSLGKYLATIWAATTGSILLSLSFAYRQYRHVRRLRLLVKKLKLVYRRNKEDQESSEDTTDSAFREQKRYRSEIPDVVAQYKEEANRYRSTHNRFQAIIIMGSVLTSAITTASVSYQQVRWAAVAVSAITGLAAGFTGYFKYRERSFNLQQAADAIEREYESVELRVGRYKGLSEPDAYAHFADAVERMRDEQSKREQQLDQPSEVKRDQ